MSFNKSIFSFKYFKILIIACCTFSCKKLVQIPPPRNTITTSEVFADSADAGGAVSGIYASVIFSNNTIGFCNGAETICLGLSADELVNFNFGNDIFLDEMFLNTVESRNTDLQQYFWTELYTYIYQANACIEGLQNSTSLSKAARNQFMGEAKFFRSLFYFYLVNIFGDVPQVTSTNWQQSDTLGRTNTMLIYQGIINDLKEAKNELPSDYSFSGGNRTRINKAAAGALLARTYLYLQDWEDAKLEADSIINNPLFSLVTDLGSVFLVSSPESILQWQLNTAYGNGTSTAQGVNILPLNSTQPPGYYISAQLLNSFEPGDKRMVAWLSQSNYNGVTYIYPYKYKLGASQVNLNADPTEYYAVLRLAEQYLIRAEAKAEIGTDLNGSAADLNMIRNRAGLSNTSATTQTDLLSAIAHERRIEFFAEWGHRWLDLKREGQINSVMSTVTPLKNPGGVWQPYQQFYPIPQSEITLNPFLKQNLGYQ